MGRSKRKGVEPTHEWEHLVPLFEWPEQKRYEQIRPLVLFDVSVGRESNGGGDVGQHALPEAGSLRGRRDGGRVRRSDGEA